MKENIKLYQIKISEEQFNQVENEIKEAERFYLNLNNPVDEDKCQEELFKCKDAAVFIEKYKDEINKMAWLRIELLKSEYVFMKWFINNKWTDRETKYERDKEEANLLKEIESYL